MAKGRKKDLEREEEEERAGKVLRIKTSARIPECCQRSERWRWCSFCKRQVAVVEVEEGGQRGWWRRGGGGIGCGGLGRKLNIDQTTADYDGVAYPLGRTIVA